MSGPPSAPVSIWSARYFWTTAGAVALIFLAAFESLAVTTVMPVVSADLNGASLYSVAFAGTLAASVIGMILVGIWCDRARPLWPVTVSVLVFVAGLLIAGAAQDMPVLVLGRIVQGLGAGGQTVALYVVVARAYPAALHGRVFAAFSAAWVVPSLIGPLIAGFVADQLHWRWVFDGVAILTFLAFVMVFGRLRLVGGPTQAAQGDQVGLRIFVAVIVAVAATLFSMLADADGLSLGIVVALAIALLLVIGFAVRPLLPGGTLRLRAGLPSVIAMRGLIAAGFLGAEVYVPYLLQDQYGYGPTFSGLALTGSAVAWAAASELQGRYGARVNNRPSALLTSVALTIGIATVAIVAATNAPSWIIIIAWTIAGAGIGFAYPRLSVLGLAYSTPQTQGFTSSALTIADSVTTAIAIAVFGLISTHGGGFAGVFALAAVIGAFALVPGLRLGRGEEPAPTT